MSDPAWPPPVGEAIGPARAAAALAAFDADIRRVGRAVVAEIERQEQGVSVDRRIVRADEFAPMRRGKDEGGCVVAVVSYTGRAGSIRVVPVCLGWDGAVYAAQFNGLDRWRPGDGPATG